MYILAKLKFQLDHESLPPYPEKDNEQQKIWNERRQAQDKELTEPQDALYQKAAALVSIKRGPARAETVQTLLGMASDANEALSLQFGLVEPIGTAEAWLLTNEQITDLENLTLGQERDNVKRWHWSSPVDLGISFFGDQIQAIINSQYSPRDLASLRSKLAQYPSGTRFWLNILSSPDRVAPALRTINDVATEHGLQVAKTRTNRLGRELPFNRSISIRFIVNGVKPLTIEEKKPKVHSTRS